MQKIAQDKDTQDLQIYNRLLDLKSFYGDLKTVPKHHLTNLYISYGKTQVTFIVLLVDLTTLKKGA